MFCGTASNGDESESTLPETNSFAPENGWLADDSFPFGAKGPISGGFHLLLVSGSVIFLRFCKL